MVTKYAEALVEAETSPLSPSVVLFCWHIHDHVVTKWCMCSCACALVTYASAWEHQNMGVKATIEGDGFTTPRKMKTSGRRFLCIPLSDCVKQSGTQFPLDKKIHSTH